MFGAVIDDTDQLPGEVRRERITDLVQQRDFVRVAELSRRFGTSEVTIRNDLARLERDGLIRRIRGGAISGTVAPEAPFEESLGVHADDKLAIGAAAAALVRSGETVAIDIGSTTTAAARALAARTDLEDVIVITNGLTIALELEPAIPRLAVVVTGGTLRPLQHSLVDPLAGELLQRLHVHTAIIGCNGVSAEGGITNLNLPEAEVKRRMLDGADRRIVVADGSKLGRTSLAKVCELDEIDELLTAGPADTDVMAEIRAAGLTVEVVG
jgi:DeoR family transcriptional regulator of aga operon